MISGLLSQDPIVCRHVIGVLHIFKLHALLMESENLCQVSNN